MKKNFLFFIFFMTIETIILVILILLLNKNKIINKDGVYDLKLDNGYKGKLFFKKSSEDEFYGFSCINKNNNNSNLFFNDESWSINFQNNSFYATKYINENGEFVIYSHNYEGKNIIYAIKYSDDPQIIKAEDFYENGIFFQPEGPVE